MKQGDLIKNKYGNRILALSMVLSVAVMVFVYMTGGTTKVYAHLMYIPIVITASVYGKRKGLFMALFGALLIGPFMPLNVAENIPQQTVNWVIRMCIFAANALIVGVFSDYDRENRKRITTILTHNENTGLKNVEAIKSEADIDGESKTIVVFSIKGIQDTMILFGYLFETKITYEISEILREIIEKYSNAELYQYYGMQFVLKIKKNDGKSDADKIIAELEALDKSVIVVENIPIYLEVRIGITEIEGDVSTYEGIRQALIAYSYTQTTDVRISRFDGENERYFKNILDIAGGFSSAIYNHKICAAYQNIVSSKDGKVSCVELLARWKKADGVMIAPDLFIPIIEKTELIQELTKFMILCAIDFLEKCEDKNINVSINFSKRDFANESIDFLLDSIDKSGVEPSRIQIEVIERNLADVNDLNACIDRIRSRNIKIAIDDFGTDYSSYQYICELPLDTIKIDKSLITNIHRSETSRRLVESLVKFCTESGIKTVAEGVETKEIADACTAVGIEYMQGYYFHTPEIIGRDLDNI